MQYKSYERADVGWDPAKREAWSAESSALIYTTGTFKTTYHLNIQKQKKNENNNVQC